MRWINVTCDKSSHIVPVQQHLFNKFAPEVSVDYLDVGSEPVATWGQNVLKRLPNADYVVFGLDDYLPTGPFNLDLFDIAVHIVKTLGYERFELGAGAHRKEGMLYKELFSNPFLEYGPDTPYSVSCQFSIWQMTALRRCLAACTDPWNFEVKGRAKAACFSYPVMRWIEESALSRKWSGINLNGLPVREVEELIKVGLVQKNAIRK